MSEGVLDGKIEVKWKSWRKQGRKCHVDEFFKTVSSHQIAKTASACVRCSWCRTNKLSSDACELRNARDTQGKRVCIDETMPCGLKKVGH